MKKVFTLIIFLFIILPGAVQAQTNVPLKFVRDLPKNLFSARTAVLIGYASNVETTAEEDARIINQYSTQLLTDNQALGLQMLHFADKNVLLQPTKKRTLLRQYDSLKIENLLFLDITEIKGQGAQGSYVFTHTAFNRTTNLMSVNQKAFVMQAETYEKLIRNFAQATKNYAPNYFIKGPERAPLKPVLASEPTQDNQPTPPAKTETTAKPLTFPLVSLTPDGMDRSRRGASFNLYYYLGANQQEKNAGFFGQHLRKDIEASPDALKELNKYRRYKITYLAERIIFVSSVALYANEVLQDEGYVYFNDKQKVYLGIAAGSLLVNLLVTRNANQHMLRAIDEYNAFATMQNNSSFYKKLIPSGFGFGTVYDRKAVPGITLQWQLR